MYHKVSDNQWIFLLAKEDNILIRYPDGSTKGQHLPRSGILTLQPGTTAYTSDFVLIAPSRNSTTFVTKFYIPNVDLGKFNFPPLYSNISFQVPKLLSLDTAELKKTETSLRDAVAHYNTKTLEVLRQSTYEHSSLLSIRSWIIGSFSFSTWCCIGVLAYILYKYLSRRNTSTNGNPVNIRITTINEETRLHGDGGTNFSFANTTRNTTNWKKSKYANTERTNTHMIPTNILILELFFNCTVFLFFR